MRGAKLKRANSSLRALSARCLSETLILDRLAAIVRAVSYKLSAVRRGLATSALSRAL